MKGNTAMNKRYRAALAILAICLMISGIMLTACNKAPGSEIPGNTNTPGNTPDPVTAAPTPEASPTIPAPALTPEETPDVAEPTVPDPRPGHLIRTDYENFLPNESGEIPIIMFHRFVEVFEPGMDKEFTTTFSEFEAMLEKLYEQGFRLISMKDFIECNIDVPAGTMPIVFTFDDGTEGQFNLIEENGVLKVNPRSAVGIMMAFNEKHPDFGLKGIFYVNMDHGNNTFKGAGDLEDRFRFLLDNGLELGTHTWGHINFTTGAKTADQITESIGRNQEAAYSVIPNLEFYSMALPYGSLPKDKDLRAFLREGTYKDIRYEHKSILAVGANPTKPPVSPDYNPEYIPRIRMQGIEPVAQDLTWWLPKMTADRMFVSDGDPNTIVVPESRKDRVDESRLNGKILITY